MPSTTCGPSPYDGIQVRGPQPYLALQGAEVLDAIFAGADPGF
jgi:hypothetical protein